MAPDTIIVTMQSGASLRLCVDGERVCVCWQDARGNGAPPTSRMDWFALADAGRLAAVAAMGKEMATAA